MKLGTVIPTAYLCLSSMQAVYGRKKRHTSSQSRSKGSKGSKSKSSKSKSKSKDLLKLLLRAEVVPLNHLWNEDAPILPTNPPYDISLTVTHADTAGSIEQNPGLGYASDVMEFSGQHGAPTIDAIGHISKDGEIYPGIAVGEIEADRTKGLSRGGIEEYPEDKYINRGVLVDIAYCMDLDVLPDGHEITAEEFQDCADELDVRIERGDTVLIRTGYGSLFSQGFEAYMNDFNYPGGSVGLAQYLADKHIFLTGMDNASWDVGTTGFPGHTVLIPENGIYVVENMNMEDLSAACRNNGTWEFAIVLNPLKIQGATAMALNAFAVF